MEVKIKNKKWLIILPFQYKALSGQAHYDYVFISKFGRLDCNGYILHVAKELFVYGRFDGGAKS